MDDDSRVDEAIDSIDMTKLTKSEREGLFRLLGAGYRDIANHNKNVRTKIKNRALNKRQKASRKANRK